MTGDDWEHPSRSDPYWHQRIEEQRQAKLARMKEKLRKQSGKGPSRDKAQREPKTSIDKVLSDRSRKNSRTKGHRGELDVAKMFSAWCGEHVRRTPQSGGWSNAKFGVTADLVCAKRAFPFHVEVKHREGFVLDDLVTGIRKDHDKSIVQWWIQCVESCPKTVDGLYYELHKEPLLVFRRNHQPWLVMVRDGALPDVVERSKNARASFTLPDVNFLGAVVVMLLEDLLRWWPVPAKLKNHRRTS